MSNPDNIRILAIETPCVEPAAAVVVNGRDVRSNIISSQIALHTLYGGVVPEIASRKHIEEINKVIRRWHLWPGACRCSFGRSGRSKSHQLCKETSIDWSTSY